MDIVSSASRVRRLRRGGFSLIETLVASAILLIGIVALASSAVMAMHLRKTQALKMLAAEALDQEMAAVQATPFTDIRAQHDGRGFAIFAEGKVNAALNALTNDADGLPGNITVTAPAPFNDFNRLVDVTVRVEWQGTNGPQALRRTIRLSRAGGGA